MREKSSECHAQANHHVREMTEMCSREPGSGVLQHHPSIAKANGKNPSSPQQQHAPQPHQQVHAQPQQQRASDGRSLSCNEDDGHTSNGNNLPTPGGRLKFFKDGKFILELSHRRDGERTTWFPVPKKTFWPPASVTPSRQESSASLSVSDDNSSIQSSPWQRDHCWKQINPRRNISTEFNFYYHRNSKAQLSVHSRLTARKRRQPLDTSSSLAQLLESVANRQKSKQQIQLLQPPPTVRKLNGGAAPPNKSLNIIIDKLARLLDANVVSPRKRILRELERVSLEDLASKRRATPPQPVNSLVIYESVSPASKQLSSYSITSILGEDKISPSVENEPGFLRNLLKPQDHHHPHPHSHPHQTHHHQHRHPHQSHSPLQHQQPHCSPQHQAHRSPQHQAHCSPQPQHQLSPQPVYQPRSSRLESTMPPTTYISPNVAPSIHQPLYGLPILPPAAYRTPPFCWMHYTQPVHYPPPMSLYTVPSQPHSHTPSPSSPAHRYKDYREQTLTPPSDKPLNLSKHAS